jgi:hypothetical protein
MYWYSAAVNYGIIQTTANLFNISGVGASTAVAISTNGVQRLSIASSGGFTIGAPSSGNALQITGSGGATSPLVLIGVAGQTGANFSTSTPSGTINFWRLGQSGVVNWDIQNIATTGVFALNNGTSNVISATTAGNVTIGSGVAITAGGSKVAGVSFTSTTDFGVYTGSGAPSISAAKGSLYLRSDGTTTTSRAYINTDGATTWTAITTVA